MARQSRYESNKMTILAIIQERADRHDKPPTVRELTERITVSVSTMHSYLAKMAEEGLVQWRPKSHRSISLSPQGIQQLSQSEKLSA